MPILAIRNQEDVKRLHACVKTQFESDLLDTLVSWRFRYDSSFDLIQSIIKVLKEDCGEILSSHDFRRGDAYSPTQPLIQSGFAPGGTSVAFSQPNTPGKDLLAAVGTPKGRLSGAAVTDARGNTYSKLSGMSLRWSFWYSRNCIGGQNTVSLTLPKDYDTPFVFKIYETPPLPEDFSIWVPEEETPFYPQFLILTPQSMQDIQKHFCCVYDILTARWFYVEDNRIVGSAPRTKDE